MAKHPLTVDDIFGFRFPRDAQVSPDGALVAFTVADTFKTDTKRPKSQIWLAGTDGAGARPFTSGPRTDEMPRWSPDGRTLAFLSDRVKDGEPQVYLLSREGGEAQALTEVQGHILELAWMPDGAQIAFLKEDPETPEEKKRKQDKFDHVEFEKERKFARVWLVDVRTRALRQVTQGDVHAWEFHASPDGREFVLLVADEPYEQEWYRSRLARVATAGGIPQTIYTPDRNRQLAMPRWAPLGDQIAFVSCLWSDRGVVAGDIWIVDKDGANARNLTRGNARDVSSFEWSGDGQLIVVGFESGDAAIGMLDTRTRNYTSLAKGEYGFADRFWQHFTATRDQRTLALIREDPQNPPDVWLARVAGNSIEWKQITHLNPQAAEIETGRLEKIGWKGRDGMEMQGYLLLPLGYEPGRRYPMVVWVHGGPAGNYGARYYAASTYRFPLLAVNGMMVFLPNPRGSLGWGTEFTESNVGDMGGMDWQDILAGVEYCIDQGYADEERLGLAGWSYGGFMTAWGIATEGLADA